MAGEGECLRGWEKPDGEAGGLAGRPLAPSDRETEGGIRSRDYNQNRTPRNNASETHVMKLEDPACPFPTGHHRAAELMPLRMLKKPPIESVPECIFSRPDVLQNMEIEFTTDTPCFMHNFEVPAANYAIDVVCHTVRTLGHRFSRDHQ